MTEPLPANVKRKAFWLTESDLTMVLLCIDAAISRGQDTKNAYVANPGARFCGEFTEVTATNLRKIFE